MYLDVSPNSHQGEFHDASNNLCLANLGEYNGTRVRSHDQWFWRRSRKRENTVFPIILETKVGGSTWSLDAQLQDRVIPWTKYRFNISNYSGSYAVHRRHLTSDICLTPMVLHKLTTGELIMAIWMLIQIFRFDNTRKQKYHIL
jgi:hypothetical protein